MFSAAKEQLLAVPKLPRWLVAPLLLMLPLMQPIVAVLQQSRHALLVHMISVATSALDFMWEIGRRWAGGSLSTKASVPRATREKTETLLKYLVDAMRLAALCVLLLSLGLSFLVALVTLYTIFSVVWGREHSHVATVLRLLRGVVLQQPATTTRADTAEAATAASYASRTTSLKGGSHPRCIVTDEGPHFKRAARGCLLRDA